MINQLHPLVPHYDALIEAERAFLEGNVPLQQVQLPQAEQEHAERQENRSHEHHQEHREQHQEAPWAG